jgi:AP-3 complex subunit beta
MLIDVDEWGQVDLMNLLLRYVRVMLPRPVMQAGTFEIDSDVKLLLESVEPLLQSRNPAVSIQLIIVPPCNPFYRLSWLPYGCCITLVHRRTC